MHGTFQLTGRGQSPRCCKLRSRVRPDACAVASNAAAARCCGSYPPPDSEQASRKGSRRAETQAELLDSPRLVPGIVIWKAICIHSFRKPTNEDALRYRSILIVAALAVSAAAPTTE